MLKKDAVIRTIVIDRELDTWLDRLAAERSSPQHRYSRSAAVREVLEAGRAAMAERPTARAAELLASESDA